MIVGVDTGGTFTDLVLLDGDAVRIHKLPSTPDDPSRAVLEGLAALLGPDALEVAHVIHGSTVATNALLERKGAVVALLTTSGFEDVLEIGRQTRSEIYDLDVTKPEPLVPAELRFGVSERLDERGQILTPLDPEEVARATKEALDSGAEAIAICLLHSYANPHHEELLAGALRGTDSPCRNDSPAGDDSPVGSDSASSIDTPSGTDSPAGSTPFVTASCEVLPEFREYERASTATVNAFVGPVMSRYLGLLGERLDPGRVRIMASNGGVVSLDAARRLAVQTILSGPAGGAVGGFEAGRRSGHDHVVTFDMGGTSTDVSLCAGDLTRTSEAEIGGLPIRVPVIDIHTVGAGGGSIAYRDPGGSLRVGPESAGADPGPICYGRGGSRVTVTDANLFLGRLSAEHFLGGQQTLETEGVEAAIEELAAELSLEPTAVAEGVVRVANATMERAIRVISLERGQDPRDFSLVCFGGAGGLHAADLARGLGIPRVIVPRDAGTLSALGMLLADPIRDFSRTLLVPTESVGRKTVEEEFAALEKRGREELLAEGFAPESLRFERSADLRYVGQGFELSVPFGATEPRAPAGMDGEQQVARGQRTARNQGADDFVAAFHALHERQYGYSDPTRPTEIVTIRVRAIAVTDKPDLRPDPLEDEDASGAIIGAHRLTYGGTSHEGTLYDRDRLRPGNAFTGPAVVVEYSTTTLVPPGVHCEVDEWNSLVLGWIDAMRLDPGTAQGSSTRIEPA